MKISLVLAISLLGLALILAQFGLFGGQRPTDLGVKNARLKAPSSTRNSVSSQAALFPDHLQREYAAIKPLPMRDGDAVASLKTLRAVIGNMPEISVVEQSADYLHAEAQTRWLKFVDDIEFWVNPSLGVIEVRSASRLGKEDFGTNRSRIEAIRAAYLAHP